MRNNETAPYRSECGCTVMVAPTGIVTGYLADCRTPVYSERIIIEPCLTHADHPHGAFRSTEGVTADG